MITRVILEILNQDGNFLKKLTVLKEFLKYYNNFRKGLADGRIYHKLELQNPKVNEIFEKLSPEDLNLLDKLFKKDIENFLERKKLKTSIDFDNRFNASQIGFNTIYLDKPIKGLWTTGMATFYLPTKKEFRNKFTLELRSIPPIIVNVGFERKNMKTVSIDKLTTKKIEFVVEPTQITKQISEIFITTDKLWLPNIVLEVNKSVTLGIGVKAISVSYF